MKFKPRFRDDNVKFKAKFATTDSVVNELVVTENGEYPAPNGVDGFNPVKVNVPIPDGFIKPEGTIDITQDGEFDVRNFEKANVTAASIAGDYYEEGVAKFVIWLANNNTTVGIYARQPTMSTQKLTVDWGDGTTDQQDYNGNGQTYTHTYEKSGYHIIKLIPNSNSVGAYSLGRNVSYEPMMHNKVGNYTLYESLCKAYIGSSAFKIVISSFQNCNNLVTFIPHSEMTFAQHYAFNTCSNLRSIVIPENTTKIAQNQFSGCRMLSEIVFPKTITKIDSEGFANCYRITKYDFSHHESIPTLASTNAFSGMITNCEILVPSALYDEWMVATNWSTYADKIIAV